MPVQSLGQLLILLLASVLLVAAGRRIGLPALLVTHAFADAVAVGHRIAVLDDGLLSRLDELTHEYRMGDAPR